jgi:hypothetical protein
MKEDAQIGVDVQALCEDILHAKAVLAEKCHQQCKRAARWGGPSRLVRLSQSSQHGIGSMQHRMSTQQVAAYAEPPKPTAKAKPIISRFIVSLR